MSELIVSFINLVVFPLQNDLSLRFELTGGFIKNAILSALSIAVSRDGDNPVVCQKDLLQGANLQLRGRLRMKVSEVHAVCVCVCVLVCV